MTGWMTNRLTEALGFSRHSDTWGTQGTRALEGHLGTWGNRALERHLSTRTLKALGHLASQALRHLGTRKALGHLGTWSLRHSGTWALEALYLADSCLKLMIQAYLRGIFVIFFIKHVSYKQLY